MLSSAELTVLALLTWALVAYCLRDLLRRRDTPHTTTFVVLLAVGVVVWPLAWVAAVVYLVRRRELRGAA